MECFQLVPEIVTEMELLSLTKLFSTRSLSGRFYLVLVVNMEANEDGWQFQNGMLPEVMELLHLEPFHLALMYIGSQ